MQKQINIYLTYKPKKNIQEEERHKVELAQQKAEEQQEVVLVMEEEMVKLQLEEQSKSDANKSNWYLP